MVYYTKKEEITKLNKMAKIAILKIDAKTGAVKATVTKFDNDADAIASIKVAGTYALVEVHDIKPEKAKTNE
jgi:hypothetical protein